MDINRARQILKSEETIEVLRDGSPVWIEGVNEQNNTASVKPLNGQGKVSEVSVADLVEG